MSEQRFINFLKDLDDFLQNNYDNYIDENGDPMEGRATETNAYNHIMENEEYHLLTSKKVKTIIYQFMTDQSFRLVISKCYGIL